MFAFKFIALRPLLSAEKLSVSICQTAGLQEFKLAPRKFDIEKPERLKLPLVPKVPQYPGHLRPFKMQKRLKYMRGPELLHTSLIHKQFGIVAEMGGRLKYAHFEVIRMTLLRQCNFNKIFAIWRVDPPWQPVTKKGLGQQMGGGKGPIDHYVTPIKAGRVIVEVGGYVQFYEIKRVLTNIANKMPFKAKAVTYEMMKREEEYKKMLEETNMNPWTWKYVIQNNIGGCHKWISPSDKKWFGKHL